LLHCGRVLEHLLLPKYVAIIATPKTISEQEIIRYADTYQLGFRICNLIDEFLSSVEVLLGKAYPNREDGGWMESGVS
jgi:hypothetical protein